MSPFSRTLSTRLDNLYIDNNVMKSDVAAVLYPSRLQSTLSSLSPLGYIIIIARNPCNSNFSIPTLSHAQNFVCSRFGKSSVPDRNGDRSGKILATSLATRKYLQIFTP